MAPSHDSDGLDNGELLNVPCKPLSNSKDGKTDKDETLNEDGGKCNLVWNHAYTLISNVSRYNCGPTRLGSRRMDPTGMGNNV